MSEYLIGVFGICLVSGICMMLVYGQGRGESLVIGIVVLWVLISPVLDSLVHFDFDKWIDSIEIPEYGDNSQIGSVIEDAFAEGIARAVAEKFSIDEDSVRVRLYGFDQNKLCAENIRVILSGRAIMVDYKAVEKYINEMDIGECNVEIEVG